MMGNTVCRSSCCCHRYLAAGQMAMHNEELKLAKHYC
jgi:hypothetical protein